MCAANAVPAEDKRRRKKAKAVPSRVGRILLTNLLRDLRVFVGKPILVRLGLIERRSVCLKRGVVLAAVLVLVVATLGGALALNNGAKNETTGVTSPYVSQYSLSIPDSVPMAITADSNGSVWFAAANKTTLVRFTP